MPAAAIYCPILIHAGITAKIRIRVEFPEIGMYLKQAKNLTTDQKVWGSNPYRRARQKT